MKVLILGLGNRMRGDDGIGIYLAEKLRKDRRISMMKNVDVLAFEGPVSSIIGKVEKYEKGIILDAVHMNKEAGTVEVMKPERVKNMDFDTHRTGLNIFGRMLKNAVIVGIQPKTMEFGKKLSSECLESYERVMELVTKIISEQL